MTNYFELYSLPISLAPDQAAVKSKFYELSCKHHPDRYAQADAAELTQALQKAAENNAAYKTLKDSDATMAYVLKLKGLLEEEEKYTLPPAFLMEMMDLNEAVSDSEADPANTDAGNMATNALNEQLELWDDAMQLLTTRYAAGEQDDALLLQIKDMYFRKKYLLRIKERIDRFAARQSQ